MRTTLEIDDDVLQVARQMARQRGTTIGQAVSHLVRQALRPKATVRVRNGVPVFTPKPGAYKPKPNLVNRLRDGD